MVNVNKLKAKMVEKEITSDKLSKFIGIDRATLYRRINGNGEDFSIREADTIAKALDLTLNEVNEIFFNQYIA